MRHTRLVAEGGQGEGGSLRGSLGLWQLTMISIGATLGTGILVVLGEAVPKAGPAVTLAWVCGCCLVLEYGVSVAAVAVGWGEYLNELLDGTVGVTIPDALSAPPGDGGLFDLPALIVVLLAMVFLLGGARGSEEAKNAQRDLPTAIMLSLVIVTALYVLVAAVAVGAKPWQRFGDSEAALAQIMREVTGQGFWGRLPAACAVVAIAGVVPTVFYGQTCILFAMSRDGLVPKVFGRVDAETGASRANPVIVSLFCGVLAAVPLGQLADATSIGTLFAFGLVDIAVVVLRRTRPDMPRTFRVPRSPVLPAPGLGFCVWMTVGLSAVTWVVLGAWMAAGLVFYFVYGCRRSRLATPES
ncbi:amino acid permease [Streptomyces sp. S.PB5]|uniref:amino acid permease n=1 Tax=Streptomyces sp. S.PB5 TaxID=3020844 RepID=UPI0025AF11F0|nr:amino acid permease [Streptomyces sp. S.PB5]MDN3022432.1 amino acid permease [Streptomyces sp. S.PB5]